MTFAFSLPPDVAVDGHPKGGNKGPVILIVGGGYSGAALTIRLLGRLRGPLRIVIAEPRASLGRGQAYSTTETVQLMNGPAGNFSIHPNDATHLARWVEQNADIGLSARPEDANSRFIPRGLFGSYVEEELHLAIAKAAGTVDVKHWQSQVVHLERQCRGQGIFARFADGRGLRADLVVLATGVFPLANDPALAPLLGDDRLATPWESQKLDRLSRLDNILIVGASLSMVDTVASLESRGFPGRYHVISRRGHLIEPVRVAGDPVEIIDPEQLPKSTRGLLVLMINARRKLLMEGRDWQVLPLSLRPFILPLWQSATTSERLRFARHLRSLWDVTVHRAAPPSFEAIQAARDTDRFFARAARLVSATPMREQIEVVVRPRGKRQTETLLVDAIVDARGHQEHDWGRISAPLVQNLLRDGLVRRHETGFGIDATKEFAVISRQGVAHADIFAIGHPLRGVAWESSSLTELRFQAEVLADRIWAALSKIAISDQASV